MGTSSIKFFRLNAVRTQNDRRSDFILHGLRARQESLEAASAKFLAWDAG